MYHFILTSEMINVLMKNILNFKRNLESKILSVAVAGN